jgi:FkbM family methyltransferase
MNETVKKVLRTLQSEFPFLKKAKDAFYFYTRRVLRIPHEADFKAIALIPRSSAGCFIDVGANHGQSIESILLYRPDAQVVSFEANIGLADKLGARYKRRGNVRIVTYGLSNATGTFTLFVPSYKGFVYDGLASFKTSHAEDWISVFGFDASKLRFDKETCTTQTLDAQGLAPVFMKVDVEGYEYNVLEGGKQTLRQYEPVLLIESLRNDPRIGMLMQELGFEEYHYDGAALRKGPPKESPNSFLMTPGRAKTLESAAEVATHFET